MVGRSYWQKAVLLLLLYLLWPRPMPSGRAVSRLRLPIACSTLLRAFPSGFPTGGFRQAWLAPTLFVRCASVSCPVHGSPMVPSGWQCGLQHSGSPSRCVPVGGAVFGVVVVWHPGTLHCWLCGQGGSPSLLRFSALQLLPLLVRGDSDGVSLACTGFSGELPTLPACICSGGSSTHPSH